MVIYSIAGFQKGGLHFYWVVKFHVNRIKAIFQYNSKLSSKNIKLTIVFFLKDEYSQRLN